MSSNEAYSDLPRGCLNICSRLRDGINGCLTSFQVLLRIRFRVKMVVSAAESSAGCSDRIPVCTGVAGLDGELLGLMKLMPGSDMLVPAGMGKDEINDVVLSAALVETVIRCRDNFPSTGSKTMTS